MPTLAAAALGLSLGACSYKLSGMSGSEQEAPSGQPTASITATAPQTVEPATDADLAFAKAAAVDLMGRGAVDSSQPWENPRTGARGTVTPIAASYTREGVTCRDFLASYLRGTQETWYQGGACRNGKKWEIRGIRPLQRT